MKLKKLLMDSIYNGFQGFQLYYQPQFWTDSRKLYGAEALARFSCDELGSVPPDRFISILEGSGLIIPFGRWVFREAARQGRKWTERVPDFQMSINMSGYQFADCELTEYMSRILHHVGLPTENVMIEVTETYDISSSDAKKAIGRMQTSGIRVAIDDFGTGNANLLALREHPFHTVKIARQFVPEGVTECDPFLSAVSMLCHSIGAQVCQEGVETQEQYEILKSTADEVVQGYLFGKPVPPEEFEMKYLGKKNP